MKLFAEQQFDSRVDIFAKFKVQCAQFVASETIEYDAAISRNFKYTCYKPKKRKKTLSVNFKKIVTKKLLKCKIEYIGPATVI